MRGWYAIGIENGKDVKNLGTLWRTAHLLGASWIFTIGDRYHRQPSDTTKAWRHVPLWHFASVSDLVSHAPRVTLIVGVELHEDAIPLTRAGHPERCIYLLGAEDWGLSDEAIAACNRLVVLPGEHSMNVSVAGSIVMYDRYARGTHGTRLAVA